MVKALAIDHPLGWLSPGPMWGAFGDLADADQRRRFVRPAILRFANDAFMDELMAVLALHPERLAEWQARWETWEQPMTPPPTAAGLPRNEPLTPRTVQRLRASGVSGDPPRSGDLLASSPAAPDLGRLPKLYQPVQNRFYLVSASLVCRRPGLPDRRVDPGRQEQVGFVLRRRLPPATGGGTDPLNWEEYAYVQTAHGPRWQKVVAGSAALLPGEERLPMFSVGYTGAGNTGRRLFAGLIPVGRREAYVGAALIESAAGGASNGDTAAAGDTGPDTRELLFALQVTGPWRELVHHIQAQRINFRTWSLTGEESTLLAKDVKAARAGAQTTSWYVLLDLARFLRSHLPRVWGVLGGQAAQPPLSLAEQALVDQLEQVVLDTAFRVRLAAALGYGSASVKTSLRNALQPFVLDTEGTLERRLEGIDTPFEYADSPSPDWPEFLFPLADPEFAAGPFPFTVNGRALGGSPTGPDEVLAPIEEFLDDLGERVAAALPDRSQSSQPEINLPRDLPRPDIDSVFTIRCVYERPNCGPFRPPVLSAPSAPFQMAGFFDPDAPARQIRIPMPFNISPAALRRYNKSATLVVSDMLCGQLKRIRKLSLGDLVLSVLPWPFHKDLPRPGPAGSCDSAGTFGMLCSLSIPIVTLCALILLLIIVALFDLFFRWIPLLFLCFPVPGLKGKRP